MTHEADTTNFSMSLVDDEAEAAFLACVNKMPRSSGHSTTSSKSDREIRMSFGRWSLRDKLEWECMTCTFLNQPLFLSCEMCGQARPAHDAPASGSAEMVGSGGAVITTPNDPLPEEDDEEEESPLSAEERREMAMQEEEERIKQERIREIMALQQGIFNKIREENVDEEPEEVGAATAEEQLESSRHSHQQRRESDMEGSFAWMDLEDTLPISELPASRLSMNGYVGKKPADASNSTLSTAATSYSQLSSVGQFSQNWLDSSSYHSHSDRRFMDNSSNINASGREQQQQLLSGSSRQQQQQGQLADNSTSTFHSTRLMDSSSYHSARMGMDGSSNSQGSSNGRRNLSPSNSRNEAIPEQALSSLRGDSARESYLRGAFHKSGSVTGGTNASRGGAAGATGTGAVDFGALKAAVEGVSVRSFVLEEAPRSTGAGTTRWSMSAGGSNHSGVSNYGFLAGGSSHSMGSNLEVLETPENDRTRRGALNNSLPSLRSYEDDDVNKDDEDEETSEEEEEPVQEPRGSAVVGALAVAGHPALGKTAKGCLKYEGPATEDRHHRGRRGSRDHSQIGAQQVTGGRTNLKAAKEQLFEEPVENPARRGPRDYSRFSSPPATGTTNFPTGTPQPHQQQRQGEGTSSEDKRSSLSRLEGARKIPTPSLIPAAKKMSLPAANDAIFQRNLYADRKQEKESKTRSSSPKHKDKSGGGVKSIPIFNRMLRKKSQTTGAGSPRK